MQTKFFLDREVSTLEFFDAGNDQPARVSGYGVVYYDGSPGTEYKQGKYITRFMPGSVRTPAGDIKSYFNHDPNLVLGRTDNGTLRISMDGRGVRFEVDLPATSYADDLRVLLARGDVKGSSVSVDIPGDQWKRVDGNYVREIHDATMFELGPVTDPAFAGTSAGLSFDASGDEPEGAAALDAELAKREAFLRGRKVFDLACGLNS